MRISRISQPTRGNTTIVLHLNSGIMIIFDVTHISSRGESFRITLPKKTLKKLGLNPDDLIIFGEKDGETVLRKMKMEE